MAGKKFSIGDYIGASAGVSELNTGREELEAIVREVLSGRVKYCPHGRPVAVTVSRKDLEKLFLRIV